jgi:membrane protein YqaA with SNARE-associated domain
LDVSRISKADAKSSYLLGEQAREDGALDQLTTIYSDVVGVWGLLGIFFLAIIAATIGTVAGFITRNMVLFLLLIIVLGAVVAYHDTLPLPADMHRDLEKIKMRIL